MMGSPAAEVCVKPAPSEPAAAGGGCLDRIKPKKAAVELTPSLVILAAVVYGVLFFSMGSIWLPGNAAFCALLIWATGVGLAAISQWLRVPRVVGMLGAGILLANVPGGVVDAFPGKWGIQMRAAALATIFLRCGLELEFKTMRLYKWPATLLAFVPGIIEALYDAGLAVAVFGMPFTLALSLGFILKAVGPGLVVPAMFQLQKAGWGAVKGIPSTVVIAASFDDIIAITGFSIFSNIAIGGSSSSGTAWQIASGPLQVVFGLVGGYLAGFILGATRLFDNKYKRLIGIYGSALLLMFFLEYYDMLSGGALGSLAVGLVTSWHWDHGWPRWASSGADPTYSYLIERVMAKVWDWVLEPLLFSTIGTTIVFSKLTHGTVPKALLIVCTGLAVRICATFLVMSGMQYSVKERLFYAIAWSPKATVQASLSAVPLAMIMKLKQGDPDYEAWLGWGEDILTTGVFAIVICATLGTLMVFWLAPVLLEQQQPEEGQEPVGAGTGPSTAVTGARASVELGRCSRSPSLRKGLTRKHSSSTMEADHGEESDDVAGDLDLPRRWLDGPLADEYLDAVDDLVVLLKGVGGMEPATSSLLTRVDYLGKVLHSRLMREQTVRQLLRASALRSAASMHLQDEVMHTLVRLSIDVQGAARAGHAVPTSTAQELAAAVAGIQASLTAGTSSSHPHTGSSSAPASPRAARREVRSPFAQAQSGGTGMEHTAVCFHSQAAAAAAAAAGTTRAVPQGLSSSVGALPATGSAGDIEAQLPGRNSNGTSAAALGGSSSMRSRRPAGGPNP